MNKNKHGLSRYIPKEIQLQIRKNSKFSCVVPHCRNVFYAYEHLIPDFKDAREHDPDKMCLLCDTHNPRKQRKNGAENYSKKQLIEYYKNIREYDEVPSSKHNDFFRFEKKPIIKIGHCQFEGIKSIINIDGENILSFQKNSGSPFANDIYFSGKFYNSLGGKIFEIEDNIILTHGDHWDIETKNGEIKFIDKSKNVAFHAYKYSDKIEIKSLDLWYSPFHITVKDGILLVGKYSKDRKSCLYFSISAKFSYGDCGIYLDSINSNSEITLGTISNFCCDKNGIYLGKTSNFHLYDFGVNYYGRVKAICSKGSNKNTPPNAHYFVKGVLEIKKIKFPLWEENEYYLNSQRLDSKPFSWGKLGEKEELFYISREETEDLSRNKGFVGFYADDILEKPFSDKIFEVFVQDRDEEGNVITIKVKKSKALGRKITSEINPKTNKFYHPHEFAGCSPWKNKK